MHTREKLIVTGVLVKNLAGKFLLVKKIDNVGPYAGMYLTPGGVVERGEHIDDTALRELYEETGVKVINLRRVYFDDDITEDSKGEVRHLIGLLYTADYASGDLMPALGNDDTFDVVGWFSVEEMQAMPLSPPVKKLLAAIIPS